MWSHVAKELAADALKHLMIEKIGEMLSRHEKVDSHQLLEACQTLENNFNERFESLSQEINILDQKQEIYKDAVRAAAINAANVGWQFKDLSNAFRVFERNFNDHREAIGSTQSWIFDLVQEGNQVNRETHREMRNVTAAVNELNLALRHEQEIRRIDNQIESINYGFSAVANAFILGGNSRVGNQIMVAGNAITSVGHIIAGLKGMGSLAGINPYVAGLGIFSAFTSVLNSSKSQKKQSQALNEALRAMGLQIKFLIEYLPELGEKILRTLNEQEKKNFLKFAEFGNQQEITQTQIENLSKELSNFKETYLSDHETSIAYLQQISQEQKQQKIKTKYNEIERAVETAENTVLRSKEHLLQYENSLNGIYTLLHGATGNKSADLIGSKVTDQLRLDHASELNDLLDAYFWPMLPMGALTNYQHQLHLPNDFFYSQEDVDLLMKRLADENTSSQCIVKPTGLLSHLLINQNQDGNASLPSIEKIIRQFLADNRLVNKRLLLPIQIHSQFNLLVIESNPSKIFYFGKMHERLREVIARTTRVVAQEEDVFVEDRHVISMPTHLNVKQSAVWILNLAAVLMHTPAITEDNLHDTRNDLGAAIFLTQEACRTKHATNLERLPPNRITLLEPINPYLAFNFILRYNHLFKKLINDNEPNNTSHAEVCHSDIEHFQQLINDIEHTHQLINRAQDMSLFEYLINNYSQAIRTLTNELDKHLQAFEEMKSAEINLAVTKKLQKDHRKNLYEALLKQTIPINSNYSCNYGFTFGQAAGNWGGNRVNEQVNIKTWHQGYTEQFYDYAPAGNGSGQYNQQCSSKYEQQQKNSISDYNHNYIRNNRLEELLIHDNKIHLFAADEVRTKSIPCAILPNDNSQPMNPSNSHLATFINEKVFNAQAQGLGEINFHYSIHNNQLELTMTFLCYKTNEIIVIPTKRTIAYDPLFYQGPEAIWWAVAGGASVTNPNALTKLGPYNPTGAHSQSFCFTPQVSQRQGLIDRAQEMIETIDTQSDEYRHAVARFETLIAENKKSLQEAWRKQLQHIINNDHQSPLGKAFTQVNVCYKLIVRFLEMALPMEERARMIEMLPNILTHDGNNFAGNCAAIHNLLDSNLNQSLKLYLPSETELQNLKMAIQSRLNILQNLQSYNYFFDEVINTIFATIDRYLPNARAEHSNVIETIKEGVAVVQQAFIQWMNINPNDPSAVRSMQNQMAQMLQFMQTNLQPTIQETPTAPANRLTQTSSNMFTQLAVPHVDTQEVRNTTIMRNN